MAMSFKKAIKAESKLRLALAGPAGSGKTFTALTLATALARQAGDKPVAVIDTERGSASKYADLFEFDVLELDDFHPDRYVEAIQSAAQAGYGVVVIDSLSHAWNGSGGLLELVENIGKRKYNGNNFKAWGDVKPIENRLVEAITGNAIHVIATMRSKTEYVVEQNERGKAAPRKIGTAPVQRDGFEYEFDVFGEMTTDNELLIQKTRCPALTGQVISKPGAGLAQVLGEWLHGVKVADLETITTPSSAPTPLKLVTPASDAQPDRYAAALGRKEILDLLIQRQRFNDADRRTELESVFAAIEAGGQLVNMRTVKQELQQRLTDLSGLEMGAPGN